MRLCLDMTFDLFLPDSCSPLRVFDAMMIVLVDTQRKLETGALGQASRD